jgi:hypothetical protein
VSVALESEIENCEEELWSEVGWEYPVASGEINLSFAAVEMCRAL